MEIYLIRHGETDWNVQWRLQGATDIPLNGKGLEQANEAALALSGIDFDHIYSSPLERARVTAKAIAAMQGKDVIIDQRLTEMCFGKHEGTTPDASKKDINRRLLFDSPCDYIPDETGESFDELDARCRAFLEDITSCSENRTVLIVAHGALLKGIQRVMFNEPLELFWQTPPLPNAMAVKVEYIDNQYYWRS